MDGNSTIKCQHDGEWTISPRCLKRCSLPIIKFSNISSDINEFKNNSKVNVSCINKAKIVGNNATTCFNGNWMDLPICQVYKCNTPTLGQHDMISITEYTVNTKYGINCTVGYTGNGPITANCDKDGEWSINGTCVIEECGLAPSVKYSTNNGSGQEDRKYTYQEIIIYR